MKRITLLLIVCLLSFASCRSTKTAIKTSVDTSVVTAIKQEVKLDENVKVQNNLSTETVTVVEETEYFKPDSMSFSEDVDPIIKLIKKTTITTKQVDKGKIETIKGNEVKTDTNIKAKDNTQVKEVEKKTVPFPWWAVAVILGILAGLLIAFRNSPFVMGIKKLFWK